MLLNKLEKLKASAKRGRPRKNPVQKKSNRHFESQERYKIPPINTRGLSGKELEAALTLETRENLGLTLAQERNEALSSIKQRLLS